ncbi:hypothetical protein [Kineococcus arenarius]|uniref:hypothetical protein n=1 Tax=unclassified Kineococcus TaxID=2621656 RepID=UPI003D7CE265
MHVDENDLRRALRASADHLPPAPAPLQALQAGGRRRLRRRRAGTGLAVATLAAVLTVAGVLIPQRPGDGGVHQAAATFLGVAPARAADGSDADCRTFFAADLQRSTWPGNPQVVAAAALLPETAAGAPLRGVNAGTSRGACPPPTPAAVLYTESPSVRGLTVWADVANPYSSDDGLQAVTVRGRAGQFLTLSSDSHVLSWDEPDGTRWLAEASGIDQSTMITTLGRLTFTDDRLLQGSPPAGWLQAPLPSATTDTLTTGWQVMYGSPGAQWTDDRLTLGVGRAVGSPAVYAARYAPGVTFTRVHGALAVYISEQGGCLFWQAGDLAYSLCGSGGAQRLTQLAEQVEHVDLTDPRIQTAPDLEDVPDLGG